MEFSEKMELFFRGCNTECDKCNYHHNHNKICLHPGNPLVMHAQIPYAILGSFDRYVGGKVVQKDVFTVISHNGVNRVVGNIKLN